MPGRENSGRNLRARAGVALLALGTLLMLAKVGWIAVRLQNMLEGFGIDTLGVHAALGMTLLKVFQTLAFDHAALLSAVCQILVLFFALAGILTGLMLLRKRIAETAQ
jgi:hypothetical protein